MNWLKRLSYLRPLLKRLSFLKPLLLWLLAVGMVWFALQFHASTLPNGMPKTDDPVDMVLIGFLSVSSAALVIVTLLGTRIWTTRGIGLFGIFVGDVMVWATVFIGRTRQVPTPEVVSDALRAVFLTSIPLVLYGIAGYIGESRSFSEKTNKRQDARESEQNVRETFQGDQAMKISRRQSAREDRLDARQAAQDNRQVAQDTQRNGLDDRHGEADTRQDEADVRELVADTRQATQDAHDAEGETP